MAWQTIRVANPTRARRRYSTREGQGSGYGRRLTDWEKTSSKWELPGTLSTKKAVRRHRAKQRKSSGLRLNPNILTDLLAGDIASKVSKSVMSSLTGSRKRRKPAKRRKRHNPHLALIGGNPRARRRYKTKEGWLTPKRKLTDTFGMDQSGYKSIHRYRKKKAKKKSSSGLKLNAGGTMAKARRRRRNSLKNRPRDRKGRLLKVRNKRRSSRRRNVARANPRRRRRNRVRVITKIKYRTRRINVARRRKRKATRRRSRRRNTALAARVNPRRRRRSRRNIAAVNPRRRRRARVTRRRRRNTGARRNAGIGGLLGRLNLMQVAEVGLGTIAGDKIATWGGSKVASMIGVTDPMMTGLLKAGLGVVAAGFVSKFRPALALGLAVGAVNGLINEYIFTPYISPYLPLSGGRGMGDYIDRTWKADNWLAAGGAPGALAGMGNNSLNRNSL